MSDHTDQIAVERQAYYELVCQFEQERERSRRYREALQYVVNSGQSYERVQEIAKAVLSDDTAVGK